MIRKRSRARSAQNRRIQRREGSALTTVAVAGSVDHGAAHIVELLLISFPMVHLPRPMRD
jgi:hypothetical protein